MSVRTLAAVDIGTNSVKLLVARGSSATRPRILHQEVVITRIGRGVGISGRLSPSAATITMRQLLAYAETAKRLGAVHVRAVATSALRDAQQGPEFVAELRERTGWEVEVITGKREAELGYRGAVLGWNVRGLRAVFDVGGGSAQVTVGEDDRIGSSRSLPLGAVRLTERFLRRHPVPASDLERLNLHLGEALGAVRRADLLPANGALIGIGGTLACLSALDLAQAGKAPSGRRVTAEEIHGHSLSLESVRGLVGRLASMSVATRKRLPHMDPGRADVIVAGAAVVAAILSALRASRCRVSTRGIRFGLLAEMFRPGAGGG